MTFLLLLLVMPLVLFHFVVDEPELAQKVVSIIYDGADWLLCVIADLDAVGEILNSMQRQRI